MRPASSSGNGCREFIQYFSKGAIEMTVESIVGWIVCGLVVGLCARFLLPGRQWMSLSTTVGLGIAGSFLGGLLYSLIRGESVARFSLTGHNWYGWAVSILGAMLLLWIYPIL